MLSTVLQSSTEQQGLHFALDIAAVHWSCITVLQSSTAQCGMHVAKTSAVVHWCWVTAHLYEPQIFIDGIAMTQACCEPVLQSWFSQCIPYCSVLLCKPGSQQALYHCSYTYEYLPFTQVCSEPTSMHCNTVQGKMHSPLLSATVQARLTAGTV